MSRESELEERGSPTGGGPVPGGVPKGPPKAHPTQPSGVPAATQGGRSLCRSAKAGAVFAESSNGF